MGTTEDAVDGAREAAHSHWFERLARLGYVANGVLHLTLGLLAVNVARATGAEAEQSGAIATLAEQPGGVVLIWICTLGALLLGVWCVAQAIFPGGDGNRYRIKQAGIAVVFFAVATTFGRHALGGGKDSSRQSSSASGVLMSSPVGSVAWWSPAWWSSAWAATSSTAVSPAASRRSFARRRTRPCAGS
ncbi:DUF1206 domain-containing protein [Arthrobacter sp.]|uniref:DUF1206 domain-containing protein n=1 Tax=Arthrobacter sp. TaxID=1667 RepID=UPI003A91E0A1